MAGWMETLLGMEVDLSQGHIVFDRDPAPPSLHVYCGHGRPSQLLLSSCTVAQKPDQCHNPLAPHLGNTNSSIKQ